MAINQTQSRSDDHLTPDAPSTLAGKTVRELQDLAGSVDISPRRTNQPSRAANLAMIDALSRWGASGLAVIAAAAVFIAATYGRVFSFRAAIWTILVFSSLYLCRRFRLDFRSGCASAGRPFRWRANYTSSLAVLSAAFGASGFLILPASLADPAAMALLGALSTMLLLAGLFHGAHVNASAAMIGPGLAFLLAAAFTRFGLSAFSVIFALASINGAVLIGAFSLRIMKRARIRFPRTTAGFRSRHAIDPTTNIAGAHIATENVSDDKNIARNLSA
ncbi:MAG: hypothetical protein AAFR21_13990 [Pseudomonadota bacterium]